MSTFALRQKLCDIAGRDAGQKETSRNRGPAIRKFWPATTYGLEGYENREPYCAAGMSYWLQQWLKDPAVLTALGKTPAQAETWRCKSARAFDWIDWAKKKGIKILTDSQAETLHTGDIVVYDFSHIGIVCDDKGARIYTIEANTGPNDKSNEGDGIWYKDRPREVARCFLRLLD